MGRCPLDQFFGMADRNDDRTVIVGNNDIARHDEHAAAGDRHVDAPRHQVCLGMEIWRQSTYPHSEIEVLGVWVIPQATVDHDASATLALEIGEHHLSEDDAIPVAASIHDNNVARLSLTQHFPM